MHISSRAALVRNFAIAIINGSVTLIILLIAPLGLAAVIMNTFLVIAASFLTGTVADQVIHFLQAARSQAMQASLDPEQSSGLRTRRIDAQDLEQR